jgi:hypothetical protein
MGARFDRDTPSSTNGDKEACLDAWSAHNAAETDFVRAVLAFEEAADDFAFVFYIGCKKEGRADAVVDVMDLWEGLSLRREYKKLMKAYEAVKVSERVELRECGGACACKKDCYESFLRLVKCGSVHW